MDLAAIVMSAIATIAIAFFAWQTWKISNEQHKLYHDPNLAMFSLAETSEQFDTDKKYDGGVKITYSALLVNHGRIPIVVTDVWEKITDGTSSESINGLFHIPQSSEAERKKNLQELPSVIPSGDFLICHKECDYKEFNQKLSDADKQHLLNSLLVKAEYYVAKEKPKIARSRVLLYVKRPKYFDVA